MKFEILFSVVSSIYVDRIDLEDGNHPLPRGMRKTLFTKVAPCHPCLTFMKYCTRNKNLREKLLKKKKISGNI